MIWAQASTLTTTIGLTSTTPAVEFFTREIVRSDDARADNPIKRRLDFQRSAEKSTNRNPQKSKAAVMNDVNNFHFLET